MTAIARHFAPQNDPGIGAVRSPGVSPLLATDDSLIGPQELHGLTLDEAEDCYIGRRRAEDQSNWTNTLSGYARRTYGQIMSTDRRVRKQWPSYSVAMLTLVGPKSKDQYPRVEYALAVSEGLSTVIQALRDRLPGPFEWIGVRDSTVNQLAHWHMVVWVDRDLERMHFRPAVDSFVRNNSIATSEDHPPEEAIKLDNDPIVTVESNLGSDQVFYETPHPLVQYTASSLPHLGEVGEMTPSQVGHGTVEWATTSRYFRGSIR